LKFLITGHNGFKGAWLGSLLKSRGHEIGGISLAPQQKSLFVQAELERIFQEDFIADIRDFELLNSTFKVINPDIVVHFAAQPLVRESLRNPVLTFETNVNGTLNVLRAAEGLSNVKAVLIITTDKVYRVNSSQYFRHKESDPLGGIDPYSSSKAMADLLTQSWRKSVSQKTIAIARAGNVIGGGDYGQERLIPDIFESLTKEEPIGFRNPNATRPWQHVLDCLEGYIKIIDHSIATSVGQDWNIGPIAAADISVQDLSQIFSNAYGKPIQSMSISDDGMPETKFLSLDTTKALEGLNWNPRLSATEAISITANWYRDFANGSSAASLINRDIEYFESLT
jgi:CDP-glucose 4,6-dehydratase